MNNNILTKNKAVNKNENTKQYKRLDLNKIRFAGTISSEEALKNITSIQWSEDVLSGKKKVIITK